MSDDPTTENLHSILALLARGITPQSMATVVRFATPYPVSCATRWELSGRVDNSNIRDWTPQQIAQQVQLELARLQREINTRDAHILSNQTEIRELREEVKDLRHDIELLQDRRL